MGNRQDGYDERVEYGETVDLCSRRRLQPPDEASVDAPAPATAPLVDLPDRDPDWMLRHG